MQNLGERVLRTAWEALQDSSCPIDLHWCIIGWSHRHLLKAAWPSHPLRWRSIHDAARNARASQHQSLQHHAWHHIQMKLFDAVCGILARDSWNDGARVHATVGHVINFRKRARSTKTTFANNIKQSLEIPEAPHVFWRCLKLNLYHRSMMFHIFYHDLQCPAPGLPVKPAPRITRQYKLQWKTPSSFKTCKTFGKQMLSIEA